jgi:hypothetical protein
LVTVIISDLVWPSTTLPKLKLAGVIVNPGCAVVVPVPLRGTVSVGFVGSLLVIVRLPLMLPDAAGEKVKPTCADCPAGIVAGVVMPLTVKLTPLTVSIEIVSAELPEFVNTRLLVPFDPTATVPKLMAVALNDNDEDGAMTAVAVNFTTTGALPWSPCAVSVALRFPATVAFTATVRFADSPMPTAMGNLAPVTLKCGSEMVIWVMLMATFPVFANVTCCVDCFPTITWPKFMLAGLT